MTVKPIAEGWDSYRNRVVNPANSPEQIAEMRRVFYSGAMVSFVACTGIAFDDLSEDDGVALLTAIQTEIEDFRDELASGLASVPGVH